MLEYVDKEGRNVLITFEDNSQVRAFIMINLNTSMIALIEGAIAIINKDYIKMIE